MTLASRATAFALMGCTLTAGLAAAQTVIGSFTLGGKALKPAHAAAFRIRSQNSARRFETYVMLTFKPVDAEKIAGDVDPYAVAINDPAVMSADYLAFQIAESGETHINAHVGGTQYIDSSGSIMGEPGSLVATCKENTTTRVACAVKTSKPVKPMDGPSWTLDVTFDTKVLTRTPGKPLPGNGGPAGSALLELIRAVGGKTLPPILAGLTPREAASYQESYRSPAENLQSAKDILGTRLPKQPEITGGEQMADDHVILEVEGVPFGKTRMLYLIEMRLVDGRWRYDGSSSVGLLE
jgi:hypothetical protein